MIVLVSIGSLQIMYEQEVWDDTSRDKSLRGVTYIG